MRFYHGFLMIFVVCAGLLLVGCAQRPVEEPPAENASEETMDPELSDQAVQGLRLMIDEVEKALDSGEEPNDEIAKYRQEKIKFWLDYFTVRDRQRFQRYLHRGQRYKEVVQTTLEENGLPNELYFLAMIESGYSTNAHSHARAMGVWQFIAATGRRYGLRYDYYVDERQDPIQATEGAARYLRDLYNAFLSWELSMAAYNAGELRILRAIMDGKTRDFWTMAKESRLPRETRNYVPKFIAATLVGRNPEKYGFTDPAKDYEPFPSVVAFAVPSPIRLRDLAKALDISYDEIKELNPHFRRGVTPANQSTYEVWIPETHLAQAHKAKGRLTAYISPQGHTGHPDPSDHHYHIVKSGDSLSEIARQYRISVSSLKRMNGLHSDRIFVGKKLRVSTAAYRRPHGGGTRYIIRNGDSLGVIARRYNTTVDELKRVNELNSDRVIAGQSLVIPGSGSGKYQVRRGDTLDEVARRHGMTIRELKAVNRLSRDTIYVGEWLKVSQEI